jgi:hypothetical protein
MQITITRDDITLVIAVLGAVLGIINFLRLWWRDRLHAKVIPKLYGSHRRCGLYMARAQRRVSNACRRAEFSKGSVLLGKANPEPTGLEPATSAVTGRRSNQLS